jgi:hypothetical protein
MPQSGTGQRVTPVLDFPSRDGLSVHALRVDYARLRGVQPPTHPAVGR